MSSISVIRRTPTCLTSLESYGTEDSNDVTPDDAQRSTRLLARYKGKKFMRGCTLYVLAALHIESDLIGLRWESIEHSHLATNGIQTEKFN